MRKKVNSIFIDYRNKEQLEWWNNKASKLVKVSYYDEIIETATNKAVGAIFRLKGPFKSYVVKQNDKFLNNPVKVVIKVKH